MRDNLRRYRAIRDALIQCYPGQPSGTVARPLSTLAALISGIVGSKSTQLPQIAAKVPNGPKPESRVKRFARWCDNARILEAVYFLPYAAVLLRHLALQTLVLVMDGSGGGRGVTVQVVKTGITPPLATSGRFWGAEMERLHHARRLHAQQGGTPRHCAAVASTSPPPSSCLRQSASPPHSASQNCPCATARLDGALSLPCCSSVRRRRPARRSTPPRAASKSPGGFLRSWPPHTDSPLLRAAPPRSEVASYRSEKSIASTSPRAPDATMKTSGAPAPARRRQSPRSPRHDLVSLQNPAAHAPSTADATSPGTSCRHCSGR